MESRSLCSGPTLAWTTDQPRSDAVRPPGSAARVHILTEAFTNRNVIVWLSGCTVIHASDEDVVCGRGNHLKYHPGNVRLTELTKMFLTEHHLGNTSERRAINEKVIKIMRNEGRRFLKLVPYQREADIWQWVDEPDLQAKISQKLRDAYRTWTKKSSGGAELQPESGRSHVAYPLVAFPSSNSRNIDQSNPRFPMYPTSDNAALNINNRDRNHHAPEAPIQLVEGSVARYFAASQLGKITSFAMPPHSEERVNCSDIFYPIGTVGDPGLHNAATRHITEAQVFCESEHGALMMLPSKTENEAANDSAHDQSATSGPTHDLKPPPRLRQLSHRATMEYSSTLDPANLLSGLRVASPSSSFLNRRNANRNPSSRTRHNQIHMMEPVTASTTPRGILPDTDLAPLSPTSAPRLQKDGSALASASSSLDVIDALETALETCSGDDIHAFLSMDHHHGL